MFPLGSVLLPGGVLPLHVFEERYRALVRDCLADFAMSTSTGLCGCETHGPVSSSAYQQCKASEYDP